MQKISAPNVKLADLLPWLKDSEVASLEVNGIALDSRAISSGMLFLAINGLVVDGREFIDSAIEAGAVVVFKQSEQRALTQQGNCWVVDVPFLDQQVASIAANFYRQPTQQLSVVGVTGTNGKTSVAQLLCQAEALSGVSSAVLGTAGNGVWPELEKASHTTLDAVSLQKCMFGFVQQEVQSVAMEVSSHGLDQNRVAAVDFDIAVFTNLSRDHLDYHGSMESYAAAKKKLFEFESLSAAVINLDDDLSAELVKTSEERGLDVKTFSVENSGADVFCEQKELTSNGLRLRISSPWGAVDIETPLVGMFNVSNYLAVFTVLGLKGFGLEQIQQLSTNLQPVTGRMQRFRDSTANKATVVVDYAHTPDALEKALEAVALHCRGKVYCVFGCGGDRDSGKRPEMASVAERLADFVIVTNDNPRTEDPGRIIEDINSGFASPYLVLVEPDRSKAIALAVAQASNEDWVLVAGKGHEDYQDISGVRHYFSDIDQVKSLLLIDDLKE